MIIKTNRGDTGRGYYWWCDFEDEKYIRCHSLKCYPTKEEALEAGNKFKEKYFKGEE